VRSSPPSINIARLTYLLVCQAAGFAISLSTSGGDNEISLTAGMLGGLLVAGFFVWVESLMRGFSLRGFSTATLGLAVGLFCAWLLTRVQVSDLLELAFRKQIETRPDSQDLVEALKLAFDVGLFASLGFLGAALALRGNRDDFALLIPYVRFRRDGASGLPTVIDTGAIIDGRVIAIMKSGFLRGRLIVPSFVLDELQAKVAGGSGPERDAAQRGLDCLEELQAAKEIQVSVHDAQTVSNEEAGHARLIELTRVLSARLLTTDDNLTRLARLQNVEVLNLHDLDDALKPVVVVGQRMRVPLVRSGKEEGQAVGYLADGTMIVVNHAAGRIGDSVEVVVTSTLQTGSGLLVFAELTGPSGG